MIEFEEGVRIFGHLQNDVRGRSDYRGFVFLVQDTINLRIINANVTGS